MSILTQDVRRIAARALSACLPNTCLLCGADSEAVLCIACRDDLPRLPTPACPQCAEPVSTGERCGHCLADPPHFDGTFAVYRYDFPMDRLVHAFKYGSQLSLAPWFGEKLASVLAGQVFNRVMPMPLHPQRLRERGFNQSGEIARRVARQLGIPLDIYSCRRARFTAPQAEQPLQARRSNVRGAFECTGDLSGLHVLLIDDVMTSGATLDECSRVLKCHGAQRVDVAIVARAVRG